MTPKPEGRMASHIERRKFLATLGGAAVAWPLGARAQQPDRMRRIGVLMAVPENDHEYQAFLAAFREGLQKLGWTEGRNIRIDTRWAALDAEAMQRFAKELVAQQPDLIVSQSTPTTASLLQQTPQRPTSIASSMARSRPTCRCRRQPSTNSLSILRPPRRSVLSCRRACSPAPTK